MQEKEETNILENLKRKKRVKRTASILIVLILLVIVGVFIVFLLIYFKSPEKTLGIGANIEDALVSPDLQDVYVKLLGGSDKNITKIKFIFTDAAGNEYYYETREGIEEIEVPFKRSFWDWLFRRQFTGIYDYEINSEELGLEDFENINEVSVSFEYYEEGEIVETGVLDTKQMTTKTTATGGRPSGNGDDGGGTCTTGSWTNIEEYRCNKTIRERKQTRSICPSGTEEKWIVDNCPANYTCYDGAGAPIDKCINESKICVDSDEINYYIQGNVTLDLLSFSFDECSLVDSNVTEYYCYYNGTEFEIRNESFNCSFGCLGGACIAPESTEYHAIVSDASASPGATSVPVPVYLNNIGSREIFGIDITLTYDSDLITAVDVQKGSLTQDWNLEKNTSTEGQVKIALYNSTKLTSGGEIAKIIFDVNSTAPDGSATALTLTEFDANEMPITELINGIFTIQSIQSEGELDNLASIFSIIQKTINKVQSILYEIIK